MKKFYLLGVFWGLTTFSYSQLRLAVLGGHHSASVKETNSIPGWESLTKPGYSSRAGFNLGVMVDLPISKDKRWHFQPGFMYMERGRKFYMKYDTASSILTDTISSSYTLGVNYIDIPLYLTYKIPISPKVNFFAGAGPYVSLFYNGKQKHETRIYSSNTFKDENIRLESGNTAGKFKTFDAGFNVRGGLEMGNVILSGFLSHGLTNFYNASYDATFKHKVAGVTLGIWINKFKKTRKAAKDTDKDGVPDTADACPALSGSDILNGCPDTDDDGIADNKDKCPEIPGVQKFEGCPVPDTDGDGMNDEADACPTEKGVVEFNGCPVPDMDGDGLNDLEDKCPEEPGLKSNNGCPEPDMDGDGLNDLEDKCPEEPGLKSNNGCPEISPDTDKKEAEKKINFSAKIIYFLLESNKLSSKSTASLNEVVKVLKGNPALRLNIDGHTDTTGPAFINLKLSQQRAETVKKYLTRRGIDASRLTVTGYGSAKPLQSNETLKGRRANRRVEINLAQ